LHNVQRGLDHPPRCMKAEADESDDKAHGNRKWNRQPYQSQGVHALIPVAGNHHVHQRDAGEKRQPPSRGGVSQNGDDSDGCGPGEPLQQSCKPLHGNIHQPGDNVKQPFKVPHKPVHGRVDPDVDRKNPCIRVFVQPCDAGLDGCFLSPVYGNSSRAVRGIPPPCRPTPLTPLVQKSVLQSSLCHHIRR